MLIEMKIPRTIIAFSLVVRFLRRFTRAIFASAHPYGRTDRAANPNILVGHSAVASPCGSHEQGSCLISNLPYHPRAVRVIILRRRKACCQLLYFEDSNNRTRSLAP